MLSMESSPVEAVVAFTDVRSGLTGAAPKGEGEVEAFGASSSEGVAAAGAGAAAAGKGAPVAGGAEGGSSAGVGAAGGPDDSSSAGRRARREAASRLARSVVRDATNRQELLPVVD